MSAGVALQRVSSPAPMARGELTLGEADYQKIAAIIHREAGITLADGKMSLVHSRLSKRLRALEIPSFEEYAKFIDSDQGKRELVEAISALTTNVTSFFREQHHFDSLAESVLSTPSPEGDFRIWSAGCSLGAEPYSIAMTAARRRVSAIKILATDIDHHILETARRGTYNAREVEGLSAADRKNYFTSEGSGMTEEWTVSPKLREMVSFNHLNLMGAWPFKRQWDAIFCRNVAIYFDEPTKQRLWSRFIECLKPGGSLFIGHSERLSGPATELVVPDGVTTYRRKS